MIRSLCYAPLGLFVLFATGIFSTSHADTYSVTETLVSGLANYDPFDDQGGTRTLNSADIELDLEVEITIPELTSSSGPTNANLEIEMLFSWAPDEGHSEPTDDGLDSATFNIPLVIADGATQPEVTITESVSLFSYTENQFAFDQPYGVLLISAISSQSISGTYGATAFGVSASISGDSTVIYDFTTVPEPTTGLLTIAGCGAFGFMRRRA